MSITGKVQDGVVILPPGAELPNGTEVEIVLPTSSDEEEDALIVAVRKLARPRPHWPKDYALNHGHYVSGEPKKS